MLTYAPNSFMGINYNSPTVQNLIQQPQQGYFQQPYSTVPPIGGLGYNGNMQYSPQYNQMMNGGYYSGYYNYDPLEIRRQIEEQRKAERAMIKNNIEVQKMKAKIAGTVTGQEVDREYEEFIERFYDPASYAEVIRDQNEYEEMRRLAEMSNDPSRMMGGMNMYIANNLNRISQEIRSKHPVDQTFVDYLNSASDIYKEAIINENTRQLRSNIGNTYNKEAYNQLANMHRQSSFASLRQNVSVDDLSIALPSHLRGNQEYQERKNKFLNFIMQNDVRNRGGV